MKKLIILGLWILMIKSNCSAETYPLKIVYNNDTLIAITKEQVLDINLTYSEVNYYKEVISIQENIISEDDIIKQKIREENKLLKELDSIRLKTIYNLQQENNNLNKKLKFKKNINIILITTSVLGLIALIL